MEIKLKSEYMESENILENSTNRDYQTLIKREEMYRQIVESSAEAIIIQQEGKFMYINPAGVNFLRAASNKEVIGKSVFDIIPEEYREMIVRHIRYVLEENKPTELIEKKLKRFDGTLVDVEVICTPAIYEGKKAIQSVFRDITQRKETERTLKKVLQEIDALSAPIVPVLEGVAVMPLVGSIDSNRAKFLLEHIPLKIKEQSIHSLISDFSGIYTLDAMVIDYLFKISAILRLLGVRSIVTGVRPEIARDVVKLGMDLSLVQTFGTVQQAIRELSIREISK
jgi:rsbT co-antagonist protein RsbR